MGAKMSFRQNPDVRAKPAKREGEEGNDEKPAKREGEEGNDEKDEGPPDCIASQVTQFSEASPPTKADCPTLKALNMDTCGTEEKEGINEFIKFLCSEKPAGAAKKAKMSFR